MGVKIEVIFLGSSFCSNTSIEKKQREIRSLLGGKKVAFTEIDGSKAENRDMRNKLWGISELRVVVPQIFFKTGDDYKYIGNYEGVTEINEMHRWEEVFGPVTAKEE